MESDQEDPSFTTASEGGPRPSASDMTKIGGAGVDDLEAPESANNEYYSSTVPVTAAGLGHGHVKPSAAVIAVEVVHNKTPTASSTASQQQSQVFDSGVQSYQATPAPGASIPLSTKSGYKGFTGGGYGADGGYNERERERDDDEQSEKRPLLQTRTAAPSGPPSKSRQCAFNLFMVFGLMATVGLIIGLVVLSSGNAEPIGGDDDGASNRTNVTTGTGRRWLMAEAPEDGDGDGAEEEFIDGADPGANAEFVTSRILLQATLNPATTTTTSTMATTMAPTTTTTAAPAPPMNDTTSQVEVDQGLLQGKHMTAGDGGGREYLAFLGIPYAQPPLAELRFMPPVEADVWEGTRDATKFGPGCVHRDRDLADPESGMVEDEDCLYLNVYTPKNSTEAAGNGNRRGGGGGGGGGRGRGRGNQFPVLIYVGAAGSRLSASHFMKANVVLVTFEYRVGVFGSLNLNLSSASGNQGQKDQVMAFQWVTDNIAAFGGNRRKVTLFGSGFGANSISTHALSPLTSGLFQKAICSSGTAIQPGFFRSAGDAMQLGRDLGAQLNCSATTTDSNTNTTMTSTDLLNCFLNTSAAALAASPLNAAFMNTVTVDSAAEAGSIFLSAPPLQLMLNGGLRKLPLIIGTARSEVKLGSDSSDSDADLSFLHLPGNSSTTNQTKTAIANFYFNTTDLKIATSDLTSDRFFNHPAAVMAEQQFLVNNGSGTSGGGGIFDRLFGGGQNGVYLYDLKFAANLIWEDLLFGGDFVDNGGAAGNFSSLIVQLWTTFADTGIPTGVDADGVNITWTPINNQTGPPYQALQLNQENSTNPTMIEFFGDRMAFWDSFNLTDLYQ